VPTWESSEAEIKAVCGRKGKKEEADLLFWTCLPFRVRDGGDFLTPVSWKEENDPHRSPCPKAGASLSPRESSSPAKTCLIKDLEGKGPSLRLRGRGLQSKGVGRGEGDFYEDDVGDREGNGGFLIGSRERNVVDAEKGYF